MVTSKDIHKKVIMYVRDNRTKKMVWRNFGYSIYAFLENGNVRLVAPNQQDVYFDAKDVRAIDE